MHLFLLPISFVLVLLSNVSECEQIFCNELSIALNEDHTALMDSARAVHLVLDKFRSYYVLSKSAISLFNTLYLLLLAEKNT